MGKTTSGATGKLAVHGGPKSVPDGIKKPWPWITDDERQAVVRAMDESAPWQCPFPEVARLEEEWAAYCGAKYCLATNSGTAALHMAVAAAGIGPGDEVIVPAFTFLASASAILHHNAIPVFVDIDPQTFTIAPKCIEEKITDKTRAIMAVDLHGLPADHDAVCVLAKKHNLVVIEDGSQAQGAAYKGRKVGALGHMAGVSMNGSKNLSALGEGGLFTTDNEDYKLMAARVRMFGELVSPGVPREYNAHVMGWNYRFNPLEAAFARCQLKKLDMMNEARIKNCEYVLAGLKDIPGIELPYLPADRTHVFFFIVFRARPDQLGLDLTREQFRNVLIKVLQAEGVHVDKWQLTPIPGQTLFRNKGGYGRGCPWSCAFAGQEIEYRPEDYPESLALTQDMFTLGHCTGGITYPNDISLMKHYVDAFHKVLVDNPDKLQELAE